MQKLDKLDREILSHLLSNGRESIINLSKKIDLSRTAVAERINRLEKIGVIKGYTVLVDLDDDEKNNISSCLLISCEKGMKDRVNNALKERLEVQKISIVVGSFDIICTVEAPDLESTYNLYNEIESIEGIRHLSTTIVIQEPLSR